jgi:hypothetical protein
MKLDYEKLEVVFEFSGDYRAEKHIGYERFGFKYLTTVQLRTEKLK